MIILRENFYSDDEKSQKARKVGETVGTYGTGAGIGAGAGYLITDGLRRAEFLGDRLRFIPGKTSKELIQREKSSKLYKLGEVSDKVVKPVSKFVQTKGGKIAVISTTAVGTSAVAGHIVKKNKKKDK